MGEDLAGKPLRIGLIGCGVITLQNHLPGLALCREVRVTACCDPDPAVLQRALERTGVKAGFASHEELLRQADVDAVIIATPNVTHAPIALAALAAGKHVLCEKPLAMNLGEAREMAWAAGRAGVRHMTAFTYRFVPAMRYMTHLIKAGKIGQPYHYRSCRLQDWDARNLGWRQVASLAGSGELGDMLSHRIDFAQMLVGPLRRVVAQTRRYFDQRGGQPSDLEDWVAILGEFDHHATAVLESSKVATGRGEGWRSQDYCEVNGSEGSLVFYTERWNELQVGKRGGTQLETIRLPEEFLKYPGSPRNPQEGDPLITFRYDQAFEFVQAIREGRDCQPSFADGARAQAVMEAALVSARTSSWQAVPPIQRDGLS